MDLVKKIISLIDNYANGRDESFISTALVIAAEQAKNGEEHNAIKIRELVDILRERVNGNKKHYKPGGLSINYIPFFMELDDTRVERISNLFLSEDNLYMVEKIISEYIRRDILFKNDLRNSNKILFLGPEKTGKSLTASVISNELHIPLYNVSFRELLINDDVFKSNKTTLDYIRGMFSLIDNKAGVYFFKDYDYVVDIYSNNEYIERKTKLLGYFNDCMNDKEYSFYRSLIIVPSTGSYFDSNIDIIYYFDDVIFYELPEVNQKIDYIKQMFCMLEGDLLIDSYIDEFKDFNFSDIYFVCNNVVKDVVFNKKEYTVELVIDTINRRRSFIEKIVGF